MDYKKAWSIMGRFPNKKRKKEKKSKYPLKVISETKIKLLELAEKGHQARMARRYDEAIQLWEEALYLIPDPKNAYLETAWFSAAIGDIYIVKKMYSKALEYFKKVFDILQEETYQDAFTMRSMGEIYYEMGDEKCSAQYLLKAYLLEGEEIFQLDFYKEIDHKKYFHFLKTHVDLGNI